MLIFDMPGGIGNQLFSLFAARYIQSQTEMSYALEFSTVDQVHSQGRYDLRQFNLDEDEILDFFSKFGKSFKSLYYPNSAITRKVLGLLPNFHIKTFPLNHDRVHDVDEFIQSKMWAKLLPLRISGYFGDFGFFDRVPKEKQSVSIRNPSARYHKIMKVILNSRTVGIHLRLGDYVENINSIGLLGDQYYSQSIDLLAEDCDQYLVFSNDKIEAEKRLTRWKLTKPFVVVDNEFVNPVEDLLLLSSCSGIITANSTFSFWSAKLGATDAIVYPKQWRKDCSTEVSGIPTTWQAVDSCWI